MRGEHFLFISRSGFISDLAWRIRQEGHEVRMYIQGRKQRDVGDGFFDKSVRWRSDVKWASIIVFDDTLGHGTLAERLRRQGKTVLGGSAWTDRLEDDRAFAQEELHKAGSPTTPHWQCDTVQDAIRVVQDHEGRFVIKPGGPAQEDKRLVFVGDHPKGDDVLQRLRSFQPDEKKRFIQGIHLQRRIEGVEVGVGGFFDGHDFVRPLPLIFESKRLHAGDFGILTGGMGVCVRWGAPTSIFDQTIARMRDRLAQENYRGFIDLTCMVNADGIYPLEFTARFGYPTLSVLLEGLEKNTVGELFAGLARGQAPEIRIRQPFHVGTRMLMPPYPFKDRGAFRTFSQGVAIDLPQTDGGIHIEDVKRVNGEWQVAGSSGVILTLVGSGRTPQRARREASQILSDFKARNRNAACRNDIGEHWPDDLDLLRDWGYLGDSDL
jgi:phosphoribosylamine--glycine ligase